VKLEFRGKGIGKSLLKYLAKEVKNQGGGRLEWGVLKWNEVKNYSFFLSFFVFVEMIPSL